MLAEKIQRKELLAKQFQMGRQTIQNDPQRNGARILTEFIWLS
jgi:hypothetical protein